MKNPLVSVIVPCYKCEPYIAECLDSILAQTYKHYEVIIVNDGSPDNVLKIVEIYTNTHSNIKLINQENYGISVARNNAIKEARGMYILPLDGDDKIAPTYLEKAVKAFEENNDLNLVYCKASFFGEINQPWNLPEFSLKRMLNDNVIFCSAFFRKSDWEKVGGYKVNMVYGLEDYEFWLSLLELNIKVHCINDILFYYRQKINNSRTISLQSNFQNQEKMKDNLIKFHQKLYEDNIQLLNKITLNRLRKIQGLKPIPDSMRQYYLFKFINIFSYTKLENRRIYQILGIPIGEIRYVNVYTSLYYFLGIPILKVTKKLY